MTNLLYLQHLISINNLNRKTINLVLQKTARIKLNPQKYINLLQHKVIASCFFEASTRTRLSFESAMHRLGASVVGFSESNNTSLEKKGESFADTITVISSYVNAIIIRHPKDGAALLATKFSGGVPIINAGDGANQHPTQTLLDLFTIQETQHRLNNLNIAMVGDLKYGRTVHSLAQALSKYENNRFFLIAPESLGMPKYIIDFFKSKGINWSQHNSIKEVIPMLDIIYMTRIQNERFNFADSEYSHVKTPFILHAADLIKARHNMKVLHPLPRLDEIAVDVDQTPHAWYFQQASNGLYTRQALLALALSNKF
ncbi:MAG: aspartate carbamoyltransferase [Candidatus Dasytiphilus stammeri]